MKVTIGQLYQLSACKDQIDLFKQTFGYEVEVTQDNCIKATKYGIDINWAATNLLTLTQRAAYDTAEAPLREAYDTAIAPLWEAYKTAISLLWEAYDTAEAPLWYAIAEAPLQEAYDTAEAPLWEAYNIAIAVEFYKATLI